MAVAKRPRSKSSALSRTNERVASVASPAYAVPSNPDATQGRRNLGMAVAMFMHWPGMKPDQYDAVMARLALDANPAAGGVLHVAALTDEGLEVCDVWQTEQAFRGFLEQRLLPVARELEIQSDPEIRFIPLHHLYAADPDMIDRIGMMAVPAAVAAWAV
jgi:hypothetical protein